jgi:hypothetical protein
VLHAYRRALHHHLTRLLVSHFHNVCQKQQPLRVSDTRCCYPSLCYELLYLVIHYVRYLWKCCWACSLTMQEADKEQTQIMEHFTGWKYVRMCCYLLLFREHLMFNTILTSFSHFSSLSLKKFQKNRAITSKCLSVHLFPHLSLRRKLNGFSYKWMSQTFLNCSDIPGQQYRTLHTRPTSLATRMTSVTQ